MTKKIEDSNLITRLKDLVKIDHHLLVHVMGGQDRQFFRTFKDHSGINILLERSILRGALRLFSFLPNREGLLILDSDNIASLIPHILEINAGVAMLEFYSVPDNLVAQFVTSLKDHQMHEFLERSPSIHSIIFEI